jgi:hypothetical protein
MQYSLFTHGTALQIETPGTLASSIRVGWGTQIEFKQPTLHNGGGDLPVSDLEGPGSWFHISLPSTLTTFGRRNPRLESVTLLFETIGNCRIKNIHVYDGVEIIQEFNDTFGEFRLGGEFLHSRDSKDINPEDPPRDNDAPGNTFRLDKPRKVFSAIGISFYASAFRGRQPPPNFPPLECFLIVSAAGGQFTVDDGPISGVAALAQSFANLIDKSFFP